MGSSRNCELGGGIERGTRETQKENEKWEGCIHPDLIKNNTGGRDGSV